MNFDQAFDRLMGFEGGYVNNPADPGRATNFGITEAVARSHGYAGAMQDLPRDTAKAIYLTDFWNEIRAETLPDPLRYAAFDTAVNCGVARTNSWLQASMFDDAPPEQVVCRLMARRLAHYTNLTQLWPTFGRGWTIRCATILGSLA